MATSTTTQAQLPGRLGDPEMSLGTDPRADARMVAAITPLGLDAIREPSPVTAASPLEERLAFCAAAEPGYAMMFDAITADLPPVVGVSRRTETITGVDGNEITLYIHSPENADGPVPGVVHFHGGGMAILKAADAIYVRWRDELAMAGTTVVGVEFRNAAGELGPHPFPAGLNDCASAVEWADANREALGVSKLIVSGESGGGNLTLATTLKAKQDGVLDRIDGAYALCPYISNAYAEKDPSLTSLYENDGYFTDVENLGALASVYCPDGTGEDSPLAWPSNATAADVEGFPPTVISVNELDPLRDEGLAMYRLMAASGVPVASRTVNGTCHAGDVILQAAMPEVYAATIRDIASFANSL